MAIQQENDLFTVFNDGVDKIVEAFRGCEEKLKEIKQIESTKDDQISAVKAQCKEKRDEIEGRCAEKDGELQTIAAEKSEAQQAIRADMGAEIDQATVEIKSKIDQVIREQQQQDQDIQRLKTELDDRREQLNKLKAGGAADPEGKVSAQQAEVEECRKRLAENEIKLSDAKAQAEKIRGGTQ